MQSRYYKYAAASMLLGHLIISSLSRRTLDLPFIPKKILDTRILEQSFCLVLMLISGVTLSPNRNLMNLRVCIDESALILSIRFCIDLIPDLLGSLLNQCSAEVWNLRKLLHGEGKLPFISDTSTTDTQRAIGPYALVMLYPSCFHSKSIFECAVPSISTVSAIACDHFQQKLYIIFVMVRRRPQLRAPREVFNTINQEQPL